CICAATDAPAHHRSEGVNSPVAFWLQLLLAEALSEPYRRVGPRVDPNIPRARRTLYASTRLLFTHRPGGGAGDAEQAHTCARGDGGRGSCRRPRIDRSLRQRGLSRGRHVLVRRARQPLRSSLPSNSTAPVGLAENVTETSTARIIMPRYGVLEFRTD